ncbi:MAG: hypothetical protein RR543_00455 [Erysipelotrichales bacterium]
MNKNIYISENKEEIINFLDSKTNVMKDYISNANDSSFALIKKNITHSDLPTFGKRCGNQKIDKNILTYLSVAEMHEIEAKESDEFKSAKQSNISVPQFYFEFLGIKQLQRREGRQLKDHEPIIINEYSDVFLVNESLKYFTYKYTNEILEKLGKTPKWKRGDYDYTVSDGEFTKLNLTHAIHGIGTSRDELFHKLRHNIFLNDSFILLLEKKSNYKTNTFILLDKNPKFYSILNETNLIYQKYLEKEMKNIDLKLSKTKYAEKSRALQSVWRTKLAEEMMNYTMVEGNVFCPFTYVETNFDLLGTLFRASHIKEYATCNNTEAFDIENGLLLLASADSLFDKHLISIDEEKKLIFSFLISNDEKLKSQLLLNNPIFKLILTDGRMKYIEHHRNVFFKEEEKRKNLK